MESATATRQPNPLSGGCKHFTTLSDVGREGLIRVLDNADHFKLTRGNRSQREHLAGKSVALVFEKASTRTRLSLEVAVGELGGTPIVLSNQSSQMGRGEPIQDTARVLSRMVHAITLRTFSEQTLLSLAQHSTVPVLNALTDMGHPMQLLADLQTIRMAFGHLEDVRCAWIGDGNNMANSWIEAAGLLGLQLTIACPKGHEPDTETVATARQRGAKIAIERDPQKACENAQVINTDVFASMGQEEEAEARLRTFSGYQVNSKLLSKAASDAIVLHCLPAHRGEEITDAVIEGAQSRVWDQAEARLHTSKAILCWALNVEP